ncbi:hypothetical protein D9M68_862980 [compost metagenome]
MRGFGAMQLDPIGTERGHFGNAAIVRIDQQHAGLNLAARMGNQRCDFLDADMTGRARKMHEADHIGADIYSGFEDVAGLDAADLDNQGIGHMGVAQRSSRRSSTSASGPEPAWP